MNRVISKAIQAFRSPLGGEQASAGFSRARGVGGHAEIVEYAQYMRKKPTDAEKKLWSKLRQKQIAGYKFRRQHPFGGKYIADFICLEKKLIIELDGSQHMQQQKSYDEDRANFLKKEGYQELRFWNNDVLQNIEGVLETIYKVLTHTPHAKSIACSSPLAAPPQGGSDWRVGLRGRLRENVPLADTTWFRVGGNAEYVFKPQDVADLATFLKQKPANLPVTIIGVGSNLLVRDGGIEGVVVRLGRGFTQCEVQSAKCEVQAGMDLSSALSTQHSALVVGAACLDVNVAQFAAENDIAGLEFLSGIPGTIGGAVKMNGGAYGSDISQVIEQVEIVDAQGNIRLLTKEECGFSYRKSALPEGAMVTRVWLKGKAGKREEILKHIQDIQLKREETQPIRSRTGGSTFKNPDGHKAWELIDAAGCRGLKRGGAQVSEKHCNFLINTGNATADDLEQLGEEVRLRVKAHSGIELEWEIKRVGKR